MPKRAAQALTALKVRTAKPGTYGDGGGLMLVVSATSASWIFRYSHGGRRRDMGLGSARGDGAVSLAEARQQRDEARSLIMAGQDPLAARSVRKAEIRAAVSVKADTAVSTFQAATDALHRSKAPEWKNHKHGSQWMATMVVHVFPKIGNRPVAEINTDDVLRVLQPIWVKTPETASRVRGRIEAVLNFATAKGLRPQGLNPATWRGHLSELLATPSKLKAMVRRAKGKGEHHPSLPWQAMPSFMTALQGRNGMAALALRFGILTGARSNEVRMMMWGEIDEAAAVWTVPAKHMKGGKTHIVALSEAALAVLTEVKPLAAGRDSLVFPGTRRGKPLSDMTLSMLVRGMATDGLADGELPRWRDAEGLAVVPHGFRATLKSWTLAKGWPDHLSERALSHADKDKVRAAYARDALVEERRPMMQQWGEWCLKSEPATLMNIAAERAKRTLA